MRLHLELLLGLCQPPLGELPFLFPLVPLGNQRHQLGARIVGMGRSLGIGQRIRQGSCLGTCRRRLLLSSLQLLRQGRHLCLRGCQLLPQLLPRRLQLLGCCSCLRVGGMRIALHRRQLRRHRRGVLLRTVQLLLYRRHLLQCRVTRV